jgi:hypothetical protein
MLICVCALSSYLNACAHTLISLCCVRSLCVVSCRRSGGIVLSVGRTLFPLLAAHCALSLALPCASLSRAARCAVLAPYSCASRDVVCALFPSLVVHLQCVPSRIGQSRAPPAAHFVSHARDYSTVRNRILPVHRSFLCSRRAPCSCVLCVSSPFSVHSASSHFDLPARLCTSLHPRSRLSTRAYHRV